MVRLDGGSASPTLIAARRAPGFDNMTAVSSYYAYWPAAGSPDGLGGVFRAPENGGVAQPLVETNRVIDIEIAWSFVHFAVRQEDTNMDGRIYRAPRQVCADGPSHRRRGFTMASASRRPTAS